MKKRLLAIVLSVAMVLSGFCVSTAFAGGEIGFHTEIDKTEATNDGTDSFTVDVMRNDSVVAS